MKKKKVKITLFHAFIRSIGFRAVQVILACVTGVILTLSCYSGPSYGADYYVSQSGNNSNPGTESQPWRTIQNAADTMVAGDTVYIRAGTYTDETIQPQASGLSESERITYSNYNDEQVILTESVYCVRIQSKSYITVLGLKFRCRNRLRFRFELMQVGAWYLKVLVYQVG